MLYNHSRGFKLKQSINTINSGVDSIWISSVLIRTIFLHHESVFDVQFYDILSYHRVN